MGLVLAKLDSETMEIHYNANHVLIDVAHAIPPKSALFVQQQGKTSSNLSFCKKMLTDLIGI